MRKGFPFHLFNGPLHRAWKADRHRRHRIPLGDSVRGCVGLAALWNHIDAAENHGDKVLYPNDAVSWIALRDLPPGCFPGCGNMNRRDVNYASTTLAKLVHGMPYLDFSTPSRDAVDFRMMPFSIAELKARLGERYEVFARADVLDSKERAREFAVLNVLSHQMTDFAFNTLNDRGRPVKPAWYHRAGRAPTQRITSPAAWFPKAYLGFDEHAAASLYHRLTQPNDLVKPSLNASGDGREWLFSYAFKAGFCGALAEGMPLGIRERCKYLGRAQRPAEQSTIAKHLGLVRHQFLALSGGDVFTINVPHDAVSHASPGETLEAGDVWCSACPSMSVSWKESNLPAQWKTLPHLFENAWRLEHFWALWFEHQGIRLKMRPKQIFFLAPLVASAVAVCEPTELLWDFSPAETYVDSDLEAALFPPMRASRWDHLSFNISDVRLDAAVGDPRFLPETAASVGRSPSDRVAQAASRFDIPTSRAHLVFA